MLVPLGCKHILQSQRDQAAGVHGRLREDAIDRRDAQEPACQGLRNSRERDVQGAQVATDYCQHSLAEAALCESASCIPCVAYIGLCTLTGYIAPHVRGCSASTITPYAASVSLQQV